MRMASRTLIPIVLALSVASCEEHPTLVDTLGTAIDANPSSGWDDMRMLAPIIVVASVQARNFDQGRTEGSRTAVLLLRLRIREVP